jgi:cytoskeletal protein RodZ
MKEQESIDRLIRRNVRALESQTPEGPCLDAETIAAWSGGGLPAELRAAAESHAADCPRCLRILAALAQTEPEPAPASRAGWLPLRWLVPLTAAAMAVAVWVMVEQPTQQRVGLPAEQTAERLESVPEERSARAPATPDAAVTPETGTAETPASQARSLPAPLPSSASDSGAPAPEAPPSPSDTQDRQRIAAEPRELAESATMPADPLAADAAEQRLAFAARAGARSLSDILSSDPAVRWRIAGSAVERSVDGGTTWQRQETGVSVPLTAGSAPSESVCWLVGRSGTVLRSTDGETWALVWFPELVDLVAITASDAQTASATTADGRTFRTADGGRTWILQEVPAAPF